MAELSDNKQKVDKRKDNPHLFKPGQSGNPDGRPKGSITAIGRVKQIFDENPKKFEEFILAYIEDPANRKHIVEMIDGKAKQALDLTGNLAIQVDAEKRAVIEKALDEIL